MPLDLSKLTDAVTKVASLAQSHATVTSTVAAVSAERDAAVAELAQAQKDVDALTAKLLSAADTPAEAVGLTAVAEALAPVAPVAWPTMTAAPAMVPPAPPVPAPLTVDELNARIAAQNAG